jgi:hypothetical protein
VDLSDAAGRLRWGLLGLSALVALAAPLIIAGYPIPDVRGGWCQSGGRPGHYTVETVAAVAWWSEVVAVIGFVVILASTRRSWTGRITVGLVCGLLALAFLFITGMIYAGRIDCAFS